MPTLRIAIDGNEANVKNRVGSNVYAFEILTNLEKMVEAENLIVTVLLSSPPESSLPKASTRWRYQIVKPLKFWTQWALPIHLFLKKGDYDVFYTPGHYAPRLSSVPYVSSVMDLGFIHFPEQFKKKDFLQLLHWTKYSVKNAKKVIAISEFTKADVVTNYHKKPEDVVVSYPIVQKNTRKIAPLHLQKTKRKFNLKQPYLLYVGTIQPRKNLILLIEAFEKCCRQLPLGKRNQIKDLQLVIAGKVGWLAEPIMKRIAESPFGEKIIVTGFVSDLEKQILIDHAASVVLVGLYEGFGIPPLEALAAGVIPVVSNVSSLPEVVGKAGILVDPNDAIAIAAGLNKVLTLSSKEAIAYEKARSQQLAKFFDHNPAAQILEVLRDVVREGKSAR